MRRYITIFLICIFIFIIPLIFTKEFEKKQKQVTSENIIDNNYDYKNYKTIRLLHSKTGQVEEINLDDYLYGVVSSEMPVDFELEALKAQAVVARTYTLFKIKHAKHEGSDICDDSNCCQAWISKDDRLSKWPENKKEENWNKIVKAVNETQGKIITYDNEPINAFFHSNSGGTTEVPINVWGGGSNYPYLQVVQTAGEEGYKQYDSNITLSKEEFVNKIMEKYPGLEIDWNDSECVKIVDYTESGRVRTLKVGNKEISGVEIRKILGLRSTNFEFQIEKDNISFSVKGYGHGVGMSQTGADSMAKAGSNYEEIIKHFYVGVLIEDI